jgi:competence protein ComEC
MPVVAWSAAGFVAGLAAGLLQDGWTWALAPVLATLALGLWRRWPPAAVVATAAAGGLVWGAGARAARGTDCRLMWQDGQRLALVAEPRDRARASRAVRAAVRSPARCAGPIMLQLPRPADVDGPLVVVGTWVRDAAADDEVLPRRPERLGRFVVRHARPAAAPLSWRARLRIGAERRLTSLYGDGRAGLAAALTVTPEASLGREERERFTRSGLVHLLSISGFHVGLLASALLVVLRAARAPPHAAWLGGTAIAGAYVWLLGFPAPALRAWALLALWCWARLRQRPPLPAALLATTAWAVALADPWAVLEAGPWLSFAGVWGCVAAAAWWRRLAATASARRRRLLRWTGPVAVSIGATLATAPVTLLVFGTVTPAAILANVAAVPLAAVAVPAIALSLLAAPFPPVAHAAAAGAGLGLDLLDIVATHAADWPWGRWAADEPRTASLALGVAALMLLARVPRRGNAVRALRARGALAAAAVGACAACIPIIRSDVRGYRSGRLTIHFLSVGQGDAAVVRTPGGRWIVVDGGPRGPAGDAGARRVVPFLRRRGVSRLALVVATHGDADHVGGLPAVLRAFPADVVLEPGEPLGKPLYRAWLAAGVRAGARWIPARRGDRFAIDGVTLRVLHPDSAWLARRAPANENSVVLALEYGRFRALLPGDAGLPMEVARATDAGDVTLLKVGHHASRSASGPTWLAALRPEWCVVSVGSNRYGHPDPGVLGRLGAAGCTTWRTDRAGDVTVETDGARATLRAAGTAFTLLLGGPP